MYFGASFSRYGFDFRPLFIQFFAQTALNNFRHSLTEANQIFEQMIQSYTFDQHHSYSSSSNDAASNPFVPPMVLINYTPLAIYCNALLAAFNDLRLCCPLAAVVNVRDRLTDSLTAIRDLLCAYYHAEKLTLTVVESEHFLEFLKVFTHTFLPYISTCLQALFPDGQLAKELGVSVLDVSEKSKLNRIDIEKIIEPIQVIMDIMAPKKMPLLEPSVPVDVPTETVIEQKEDIPVEDGAEIHE